MNEDWALERAREIWDTHYPRKAAYTSFLDAIAAELRKERERTDADDRADWDAEVQLWKNSAMTQQKRAQRAEARAAALEARLRDHIAAAERIRHWHDTGRNNEGMIVSAAMVRALWSATDQARQTLADHGGALAKHDAEVRSMISQFRQRILDLVNAGETADTIVRALLAMTENECTKP